MPETEQPIRAALTDVNTVLPKSTTKQPKGGFGSSTSRFDGAGSIYGATPTKKLPAQSTPAKSQSKIPRVLRSSTKKRGLVSATKSSSKKPRGRFDDPNSIYAKAGHGAQPPTAEQCPHKNAWADDDPNYCQQNGGKGFVEMKKPKRSRFSDMHSIHGTRKNRERWGEKAMTEIGLSAGQALKAAESKGGGYVPSQAAAPPPAPNTNVFGPNMYQTVFESLNFAPVHSEQSDEVKPLGLFDKQNRSKHGRFSSIGCIYK